MALVIVERTLDPALSVEDVLAGREANRGCYSLRRVKHVTTYLSADGRRAFCVFEAPDAASVREADEQAGNRFDRVWTARDIPDPPRS